jgi:hypothetical protein
MKRYILMSENGNNLEEGNTVADKNLFLFFARHNFKNCSVSVIDTATQREYFYNKYGQFQMIEWQKA